ncbi:MAG: tRNA-intron lyase [Methanomassiliicoccaceae archaeon]|nr:tRNA-intron lyase [Methanomassiliicoccaceae archaeon]
MAGVLKEGSVIIADPKEGNQIYNKGNFGYPMSGGSLELDLIEATFLLETGRLEVLCNGERMTFESLFTYSSSESEGFDIRYMVYRDIRQRGFVVKPETSDLDLSVFPRGKTISNSRPKYLVKSVSERTAFTTDAFMDLAGSTQERGRELLFGIVDEEGDMTYYIVSKRKLSGSMSPSESDTGAEGKLIRDRVFIFDSGQASSVHSNGAFGMMSDNVLQLSLIETCYLMSKGIVSSVITEKGKMKFKDMMRFGRSLQDEFDLRYKAFTDMRDNGLVVKTGFKYGTHFRVYERHPDECHARYLVHSVDGPRILMWPEISRAVRLAHGVKKEILFCRVNADGNAEYLEFKRFRP